MSNRFEDMSIMWVFVIMDDNICIFIKFDVWIVIMMNIWFSMYDYSFDNVIFFNNVIWCCIFNSIYDNIVDVCCFMIRFI